MPVININSYEGNANLAAGAAPPAGTGGALMGVIDLTKTPSAFEKLQLLNAQKNKQLFDDQKAALKELQTAIGKDEFDLLETDPLDRRILIDAYGTYDDYMDTDPNNYSYNGKNYNEFQKGRDLQQEYLTDISISKQNYVGRTLLEEQKKMYPQYTEQIDKIIADQMAKPLRERDFTSPFVPAVEFDQSMLGKVPSKTIKKGTVAGDFIVNEDMTYTDIGESMAYWNNSVTIGDEKQKDANRAAYDEYLKRPQEFVEYVDVYNKKVDAQNEFNGTNYQHIDPKAVEEGLLSAPAFLHFVDFTTTGKDIDNTALDYTGRAATYAKLAADSKKEAADLSWVGELGSNMLNGIGGTPIKVVPGMSGGLGGSPGTEYAFLRGGLLRNQAGGTEVVRSIQNIGDEWFIVFESDVIPGTDSAVPKQENKINPKALMNDYIIPIITNKEGADATIIIEKIKDSMTPEQKQLLGVTGTGNTTQQNNDPLGLFNTVTPKMQLKKNNTVPTTTTSNTTALKTFNAIWGQKKDLLVEGYVDASNMKYPNAPKDVNIQYDGNRKQVTIIAYEDGGEEFATATFSVDDSGKLGNQISGSKDFTHMYDAQKLFYEGFK